MTTEAFVGSLPQTILDQLTTAMGIENRLGTSEDVRVGAPPRVTWVPAPKASRRYKGTAQQRRDDLKIKHVHDVEPLFEVHLWGESYGAAEALEVALEKALYTVFSPNAYELSDGEQEGEVEPGRRDFLFVIPVRLLRVPLAVATFQTVKLGTITAPGTLTDPQGGTPTPGPSAGVTIP